MKHKFLVLFLLSVLFSGFCANLAMARGPLFQVFIKNFKYGTDENGYQYCDFDYGIKNLSGTVIDKLGLSLKWQRKRISRGYNIGVQDYDLFFDDSMMKPERSYTRSKYSVRRWCKTIEKNGPNIEVLECMVDGEKKIPSYCQRLVHYKFYNQQEVEKAKEKETKEYENMSSDEAFEKALDLVLGGEEDLIKKIKGVEDKKTPQEEMQEILDGMDNLAKEVEKK